jgi:PhnB protein
MPAILWLTSRETISGQITMPLTQTLWSPKFGMLADRFGIGWMITELG